MMNFIFIVHAYNSFKFSLARFLSAITYDYKCKQADGYSGILFPMVY